jgi:hypothetical protein
MRSSATAARNLREILGSAKARREATVTRCRSLHNMSSYLSGTPGLDRPRFSDIVPLMKEAGIQVVRVRTDELPQGKLQLWFAAMPRQQALSAVLNVLPDGWTVRLDDTRLSLAEAIALHMPFGAVVRKFRE